MMANGYAKLTTDEYAQLTTDGYAQLSLDSGDTPTTSCAWTTATVAALQQSITSLASQITSLASQVSALQTAVGVLPTSVPTSAQIASAVWSNTSRTITGEVTIGNWTEIGINMITSVLPGSSDFENLVKSSNHTSIEDLIAHGDSSWATASGFAKPADVTTAKEAIITQGDSAWTTATGFATSEMLNGVPEKIWTYYDDTQSPNSRTLTSGGSGGATAAEVWAYNGGRTLTGEVTVNSEQATAFSQVADVSGLATSSALSAVKTAVDAIPTTTYTVPTAEEIKNAVWSATSKTITGDVNVSPASVSAIQSGLSTFDASADTVTVNSTQATAFSQVADVSGLATAANLTTALTLLNKLFGLIGYFSVSSNTLTTYNASGTALATYTLTRDSSQNITGVTPNA